MVPGCAHLGCGPLGLPLVDWNLRFDHLRMASNSGPLESWYLVIFNDFCWLFWGRLYSVNRINSFLFNNGKHSNVTITVHTTTDREYRGIS